MASEKQKDLLLEKIISGGQTGADVAGLEVAEYLGLKTGGWAPPGFMTTKGKEHLLELRFGLKEIQTSGYVTPVTGYIIRSKMNVNDSDATVVFKTYPSAGTDKTIGYCLTGIWQNVYYKQTQCFKPFHVISRSVQGYFLDGRDQLEIPSETWKTEALKLREFLITHKVKTLNVAGHRQSSRDPFWQKRVFNFLLYTLSLKE